jgi:hypothetical protein|nr:MAG TPA: Repressor protein CI [Caudoviricetes sp.]
MSTFTERINMAYKVAKKENPHVSKSELAKVCGVTPSAVSWWFSGKSQTPAAVNTYQLAKYLNVSERWLVNGIGDMKGSTVVAIEDEDPDNDQYVGIPESRIAFQGGDGFYGDSLTFEDIEEASIAYYKRSFFVKKHINPARCKRFKVTGQSMEPLLWDGDVILVDCAQTEILSGKIYAFALEGKLRVKILHQKLKGGIIVKSANPDYPEETLTDNDLDTFKIIGRVCDRSGGDFL